VRYREREEAKHRPEGRAAPRARQSVGGVLVGVGVPLFIVGLNKESKYDEWKKRHAAAAGFGIVAGPGGAGLGYRIEL
jgi:hypothetical protein